MSTNVRFRVSGAIENTARPPIPQAYAWGKSYTPTPTRPLLDMSQGVPGVPPPKLFLDTLARVSADPKNCGYVENVGEKALREAVVEEMKIAYAGAGGVDVTADDVAITAGCNLAFFASVMTVAEKGDEVILPVPWYFNHEMTLTSLGINIVTLPTSPELAFQPSVEECNRLITPKTKAIVLVTPNNPTGAIYPASLIASFAKLAHDHKIALILDETYRDFLNISHFPPHHLFTAASKSNSALPSDWSWRSTIIHLFSFSKSYCIPGHRAGLIAASPSLINEINKALDNIQICAPRPPQLALAACLPQLRPFVKEMSGAIEKRHVIFKQSLPPTWRVGAQGGYYAFVQHPFKDVESSVVCERLAKEMGVICLPAGFFGPAGKGGVKEGQRWVRFSVANVSDEKVRLVCERLKESEDRFEWDLDRTT